MMRLLLSCCLLLLPLSAFAQKDPEPKDGKVTILLTISPAAIPQPIADYYLLPEYRDLQPGDKLSGFMKCMMEQAEFYKGENSIKRWNLTDVPLAELPADVREQNGIKDGIAYNPKYATMMVFMDQAARYTRVEWNDYFNLRHDGVYMLLPEIQKLREFGVVLRLRMRGEVKNGEFTRALASAKSLFGLAKMLEQHPTLIGELVGLAVSLQAIAGLEEAIQQPGCPNLFWSFTDLPSPFIDLRYGLGGERTFLDKGNFVDLKHPTRALSPQEVNEYLKSLNEIFHLGTDSPPTPQQNVRTGYALIAADEKKMEAARKRLTASGLPPELVKSLPPLQLAMIEDFYQYTVIRDELFKWMNLPYPLAIKGMKETEEKIKSQKSEGPWILGPAMLPTGYKVKSSQARVEQRLAFLRVIEAIRLYAQENAGKLPASLDDIKLPLPTDPLTGKPFEYTLKNGDTATLQGAAVPPQPVRAYEIRVRK